MNEPWGGGSEKKAVPSYKALIHPPTALRLLYNADKLTTN